MKITYLIVFFESDQCFPCRRKKTSSDLLARKGRETFREIKVPGLMTRRLTKILTKILTRRFRLQGKKPLINPAVLLLQRSAARKTGIGERSP
ncbi:MAG: hypothetical protein AB3K77_10315 [Methanosarcinaceae archaeon]